MTHFELLRDRGILVVTAHAPLEKADFEQLAKEVDPFIASKGKLTGVMICAEAFPGWENFEAFVSHVKFVANHHRQIERVAGDQRQHVAEGKKLALAWLETTR